MNHSFATIESCKMKFAVVLFAVLASAFATHPLYQPWEDFKVAHGKTYSGEEELLRFMIFADNVEKINKHNELYNKGQVSYSMGLTKFADMTHEEFKQYLSLSGKPPKRDTVNVFRAQSGVQIPASVDWRTKGAVNGVKDQGQCGSCWAFSTVGSLESINYLQKGQLYSLSEQNLVDCSGQYGNQGCNGGSMEAGYEYIRDNGVESEDDYPYTAQDGTCQFDQSRSVLTVSGYTSVEQSEDALAQAVASVGPIAIAVDASEWQFYTGGIFSTPDFNGLDHGVVAVGYGTESGQDYWIVRNSWGPSWGESGYIRVARNDNNQIGITNDACYPNL